MKREFVINIGLLLIANLFIKAFYLLGIDRQIQLTVGTANYGLYYNLLNITLIFQFINDFGIQNYTNRYVSQNRSSIQHQYKDFAGLKIALSFIYLIVVILFAGIMEYNSELYPFIFHLAFNQILISGIFFIRSNISGLGFYKTDSFFSILDRILLILMGSILLWHPYFRNLVSIHTFVWIQTISLSATLIAAILFIRRKHLSIRILAIDFAEIKNILKACLPFAMIYLFSSFYNKIDVVLIGKMLKDGNQQSGIYAASMRLFEAFSMISLAFGSLLLAMFSALYANRPKLQELFIMAMNLLAVITIIISLNSAMYSRELIKLLYNQTDPYWVDTFRIVMLAFIPASLNYIFGALLPALHKERQMVMFYIIASLVSLTVNLWLITNLKVIGAAIAIIVTQSILFIIQFVFIRKIKLIELTSGFWRRMVLFTFLSILISFGVQLLPVFWILKIIFSIIGMFVLAMALKMVSIKDFLESKLKMN